MSREEAIEEGGFIQIHCRKCERLFWSERYAYCDWCRWRIKREERNSMEIDYTVTLTYGEDGPNENEPSPTEDDIAKWVKEGMERDGFSSVDVRSQC